ncbi:hypothetical protein AgCh_005983 [Apium graveolens]
MRRGLYWGWGGDEEEGVFEEENWALVVDTDADERLLRNKEERGIGKMGKRKKVAEQKRRGHKQIWESLDVEFDEKVKQIQA